MGGKEAYNAYLIKAGNADHHGSPMPEWFDLPARVRSAWEEAYAASLAHWSENAFRVVLLDDDFMDRVFLELIGVRLDNDGSIYALLRDLLRPTIENFVLAAIESETGKSNGTKSYSKSNPRITAV